MSIFKSFKWEKAVPSLDKIFEGSVYYMIALSICWAGTLLVIGFANRYIEYDDQALYDAIQKADLQGFFLLVGSVIGSIGMKTYDKRPIGGALVCAFALVFASMTLRMVPAEVRFQALADPVQSLLGWVFILCPASMIGIVYFCMAALFQAKLDVTPDPTSKTADAPTVPAPSDLARDLRLSRSRARRSRVAR